MISKTAAREFEQTKTEYEILEQEMEALDTKIEQTREAAGSSALLTQQLEGQRNVLKEQGQYGTSERRTPSESCGCHRE